MKYSTAWVTLREQIQNKIKEESDRVKGKDIFMAVDVSAKCAAYGTVLALMNDLGTSLSVSE